MQLEEQKNGFQSLMNFLLLTSHMLGIFTVLV